MPSPVLPPLALYIHLPWCVRKCPYCDFNSHTQQGELPEAEYVAAMLEDLDQDLDYVSGRAIQSVFIGGGTPSLFSAEAYRQLFAGLRQRLCFADEAEITLEANPGTLEQGRFAAYRELGINRLSIGVQSFDPLHLQQLGRIHSGDDARRAIASAREAGFDNFNVDLMHGLSGQQRVDALRDLDMAIDSGASHISWYQLTIEPNTEFYRRPPTLPPEGELMAIQEAGFARLREAGFQRYEVSAFARPGRQARHNLNYWQFGDYLALGAGAHGKITRPDGRIVRYQKTRMPKDYLQRRPSRSQPPEVIAADDLPFEFLLNALRLRDGFTPKMYEQRTGLSWTAIDATVTRLQQRDLLQQSAGRIACTERGYAFVDSILQEFLPG